MADDPQVPAVPAPPTPPPADEGFLHSLATSLGLDPEAVKAAGKSLWAHPIQTAEAVGSEAAAEAKALVKPEPYDLDPAHHGQMGGTVAEGVGAGLGVDPASQATAAARFKKPGVLNKIAGSLEYAGSGVPLMGPGLAKSQEQAASGNARGSMGTLLGTIAPALLGTEGAEDIKTHLADTARTAVEGAKEEITNAVNAKAPAGSTEAGAVKMGNKTPSPEPQAKAPVSFEQLGGKTVLSPEERGDTLLQSEKQSALPNPYRVEITSPDGLSHTIPVDALSPQHALKVAQKQFPNASQWEITSSDDRTPSDKYSVPTQTPLSVRGARPERTAKQILLHENGHAMIDKKEGFRTAGMFRHTHPDMPSNASAAIGIFRSDALGPNGKVLPEKLGAYIRGLMGGPAADEAYNALPRDQNHNMKIIPGSGTDGTYGYQTLRELGYRHDTAMAYLHQAIDDNVAYLTKPEVSGVIHENVDFREPNLSTQFHVSDERFNQMHGEVQRRIAANATKTGSPNAGAVGEGNVGSGAEDVPSTEGGSPEAPGQAVQTKLFNEVTKPDEEEPEKTPFVGTHYSSVPRTDVLSGEDRGKSAVGSEKERLQHPNKVPGVYAYREGSTPEPQIAARQNKYTVTGDKAIADLGGAQRQLFQDAHRKAFQEYKKAGDNDTVASQKALNDAERMLRNKGYDGYEDKTSKSGSVFLFGDQPIGDKNTLLTAETKKEPVSNLPDDSGDYPTQTPDEAVETIKKGQRKDGDYEVHPSGKTNSQDAFGYLLADGSRMDSDSTEYTHSQLADKTDFGSLQHANAIRLAGPDNVEILHNAPTDQQRVEISRLFRESGKDKIHWDFHKIDGFDDYENYLRGEDSLFIDGKYKAPLESGEGSVGDFQRAVDKFYNKKPDNLTAETTQEPADVPARLSQLADDFQEQEGREPIVEKKLQVDPRQEQMADAYAAAKHEPEAPAVKKTYDSFKKDIAKQFALLTKNGFKVDAYPHDPYEGDTLGIGGDQSGAEKAYQALRHDVIQNKHVSVWTGGAPPPDHPLSEVDPKTGLTYNSMLRAIHDVFGHVVPDNGFDAAGEESAWAVHNQMFSPNSRPALATETRAQTAYVTKNGTFAEQKASILPPEFQVRPEDLGQPESTKDRSMPLWWNDQLNNEVYGGRTRGGQLVEDAKKNGGFTVHPRTGAVPTDGYQIDIGANKRVELNHAPTSEDIRNFVADNRPLLNQHPELYVGGYDNKQTGKYELNLSAHTDSLADAKRVAKKLDQFSIWDNAKGDEIETGGASQRTDFPNYPLEERLKDLRGENQSDVPGFEHLAKDVHENLEPDERDYLKDNKTLQRNVMSQYHRIQPSVAETTNAMQAGAALGGWWKRYIDVFHNLTDGGEAAANAIGPSHAEVLKQWHAAVSGNKNITDADNLAWHSYADWLDAGQPKDRKSIDDIVRKNGAQPEGSGKKGNAAISDTRDKNGKLITPGLDTGKLYLLVNSPEMRGERPFSGDVFRDDAKNPLMGSTEGARKIPSMGATGAGTGNLNRLVIDAHIRDFYGYKNSSGPATQYIADSVHLRQAAKALKLKGGEGQEQLWGTVLGVKELLKEGLTPEEVSGKLNADVIHRIGKDYAEVMENDPEISAPGGVLDRIKEAYGIGRGSAGAGEAYRKASSSRTTGTGEPASGQTPVDKTLLAKTAERIRGQISESKIKNPNAAPAGKKAKGVNALDFLSALKGLNKPGGK